MLISKETGQTARKLGPSSTLWLTGIPFQRDLRFRRKCLGSPVTRKIDSTLKISAFFPAAQVFQQTGIFSRLKWYSRLFLPLLFSIHAEAQEIFTWNKEKEYCNPSVIGLPRPKAAIIRYELQPGYRIQSTGKLGNYGNASTDINRNRRFDVRLRFPIINKNSITIAGGLKYSQEEFAFDKGAANTYPLYQDLEDRPLKSVGLHFYMLKPTRSQKYFILRASFDLNGDYGSGNFGKGEFLKFSITPLIGWKKNENLSYALGFSYGYSFGVPLIVPVVSFNKNFNCNFGIESVLPISLRLRYTKNEKNYWYAGAELSGASYRLDNQGTVFSSYNRLHLFRSEIRYTLNYEREIHDWLWFGLEGGLRQNIRFNLNNGPRGRSDIIIQNHLRTAPVINASLFVVPPNSFLKRKKPI